MPPEILYTLNTARMFMFFEDKLLILVPEAGSCGFDDFLLSVRSTVQLIQPLFKIFDFAGQITANILQSFRT